MKKICPRPWLKTPAAPPHGHSSLILVGSHWPVEPVSPWTKGAVESVITTNLMVTRDWFGPTCNLLSPPNHMVTRDFWILAGRPRPRGFLRIGEQGGNVFSIQVWMIDSQTDTSLLSVYSLSSKSWGVTSLKKINCKLFGLKDQWTPVTQIPDRIWSRYLAHFDYFCQWH